MTNKERSIVREACEIISREVRESESHRVTVQGFGSFTLVTKKARTARNPATGAAVEVPVKTTLKFKPSPAQGSVVE